MLPRTLARPVNPINLEDAILKTPRRPIFFHINSSPIQACRGEPLAIPQNPLKVEKATL